MKYTKVPLKGHVALDVYPVYIEDVYHGHEPFRIVGIRHKEVELKGDWSGMNMTIGNAWKPISKCFLVKKTCIEELGPSGCQVPNIYCCGGGSLLGEHVEYWK